MKSKILTVLCIVGLCWACLEKVPDPIDVRLPRYTEEGLNSSGAYINDEVWIDNPQGRVFLSDTNAYVVFDSLSSSITLKFIGEIEEDEIMVEITLNDIGIDTLIEMPKLDGKEFDLASNAVSLKCTSTRHYVANGENANVFDQNVKGRFFMRNVVFRAGSNDCIFSGTFGFEATDKNGNTIHFKKGRFDYRICDGVNNDW